MTALSVQPLADRFRFKTAAGLQSRAAELGLDLPFSNNISALFEPAAVCGREVPNRLAAQPMEGCDGHPAGEPGEPTIRRYVRFAEGGHGLIWFEATSVLPEARANPRQLLLTHATLPAYRDLVAQTRAAAKGRSVTAHSPYLVLQLTHSGRFSRNGGSSLIGMLVSRERVERGFTRSITAPSQAPLSLTSLQEDARLRLEDVQGRQDVRLNGSVNT